MVDFLPVRKRRRRSFKRKVSYAYRLRKRPTLAEERLRELLLTKVGTKGVRFYSQEVVCGYIVDFYFPWLKLAIEADGIIHDSQKNYDKRRDSDLRRQGVTVLHFFNEQILDYPDKVAAQIRVIMDNKIKVVMEREKVESKGACNQVMSKSRDAPGINQVPGET